MRENNNYVALHSADTAAGVTREKLQNTVLLPVSSSLMAVTDARCPDTSPPHHRGACQGTRLDAGMQCSIVVKHFISWPDCQHLGQQASVLCLRSRQAGSADENEVRGWLNVTASTPDTEQIPVRGAEV